MKKRRGNKKEIKIIISNHWFYTFMALGILAAVAVGVYAWANPSTGVGHSYNEIQPCSEGQTLKVSGGVWTCADISDGGCLWSQSGDDIYYNDGNVEMGKDIITYSNIKIMRNYRYDFVGWSSGHTGSPRCSCDISSSEGECGSSGNTFYTNIDSGSTCYDWWYGTGNGQSRFTKVSGGPWVAESLEYKFP
jgi:hypothetical protein